MILVRDFNKINNKLPCCIALGNFDGIHLGHQEIIKKTISLAKSLNVLSAVFTFNNLPLNVINKNNNIRTLLNPVEKYNTFEEMGIDIVFSIDFTDEIAKLDKEDFIKKILIEQLNAKALVCGYNYTFAKDALGTAKDLEEFSSKYNYKLSVVPEIQLSGVTVSSTHLRNLLAEGKVSSYKKFSGRNYHLIGNVTTGEGIGKTLGYPTANIVVNENMFIPKKGVYFTKIYVDGKSYYSITNIGNKPTLGNYDLGIETHIFDFNRYIYRDRVVLEFLDYIRDEKKYSSSLELKKQIKRDVKLAKAKANHLK